MFQSKITLIHLLATSEIAGEKPPQRRQGDTENGHADYRTLGEACRRDFADPVHRRRLKQASSTCSPTRHLHAPEPDGCGALMCCTSQELWGSQVREIAKAAAPLRFLHITDPAGLRGVLDVVTVPVAPDAHTRRHSGSVLVSAARRGDRRFRRGRGFAIRRAGRRRDFRQTDRHAQHPDVADHRSYGLFGMTVHKLTPDRLAGVARMVGGIDLIPQF